MSAPDALPTPGSPELASLRLGVAERAIYELLYAHRDQPLTMREIREAVGPGHGSHEHLDRRRRNLNPLFIIERTRHGRETKYRLVAPKAVNEARQLGITERVRAEVLRFGRCEQCGRTPHEHRVVLQVDHKLPQSWGGSNDISNLQALCEECNRGKKAYYATMDNWAEAIAEAGQHLEPHRRLTTLLLAVGTDEVRSDVLEMVAYQQQHQADWQKRMRELRELGWDYAFRKKTDSQGRVWVYYRLTAVGTLPPEGGFGAAIRAAEIAKKQRRLGA